MAEDLCEMLRRKSEDWLVIFSSELIGDTLYAMSCLEALRMKYPDKKVCVVEITGRSELLKSYGALIDRLILVNDPKCSLQVRAFMNSNIMSEKALAHGIYNASPFVYSACARAENADNIFFLQTHIYSVGENAPITYHGLRSEIDISSVDNFQDIKDRTVILNPYSISTGDADKALFEVICAYLTAQGFVVYTNVVGTQQAIYGSKELRCPLSELYAIAKEIPMIVSIRSGILDFLAPSDTDMFVIYENCSPKWERMYHLHSWKCTGRIKEISAGDAADAALILRELEML